MAFWSVKADNKEPCSQEVLTDTFTQSVMQNADAFFMKGKSNQNAVETSLKNYIAAQRTSYISLLSDKALQEYHKKQQQLFQDVIKQSLQSYSSINKSLKNGGSTKDDFHANFGWNSTLQDATKHPIVALYAEKFKNTADQPDIIPVVPSLVVGFEATLNYAIFSCNYVEDTNKIFNENTSTQGILQEINGQATKRAQDLIQAKRILQYAIDSYDSFAVAYPQHVAYTELIKKLKVLRKQFYALDTINTKCVIKNHLYGSCKKP